MFEGSCDIPGMPPWTLVSLPHPSGRNLIWNQPGKVSLARGLLRLVAPGVSWGLP